MASLDELGLTIRELLRYAYPGLLLILVAVLLDLPHTKLIVEALGPVLSPLIALAIGASLYALYKPLVCDLFLEHVLHHHGKWCTRRWLTDTHHVRQARWIDAYRVLRDGLFDKDRREFLHIQQSEIHLLLLTGVVLALGTLYAAYTRSFSAAITLVFAVAGAVYFVCGWIANILLCRQLRAYLQSASDAHITTLLSKAGLQSKPGVVQGSSKSAV